MREHNARDSNATCVEARGPPVGEPRGDAICGSRSALSLTNKD